MNNQSGEANPGGGPKSGRPADEFVSALSASLDESVQDIDEVSLVRLKRARAVALQQPKSYRRTWIAIGVAACFGALLLAPLVWQPQVTLDVDAAIALDIPPSAEELDDLDMLLALEDSDA
jgi:hypothetical protein